ncbi:hypothetical protein HDU85_005544 [Gaertneriomyces sp. JEL0708]|nr:hypothetical protein HDU85_005544 [Gaertneriomyces sp. JEL0708]
MGRRKDDVIHSHFKPVAIDKYKGPHVQCNYCDHTMHKSATRQRQHLKTCRTFLNLAYQHHHHQQQQQQQQRQLRQHQQQAQQDAGYTSVAHVAAAAAAAAAAARAAAVAAVTGNVNVNVSEQHHSQGTPASSISGNVNSGGGTPGLPPQPMSIQPPSTPQPASNHPTIQLPLPNFIPEMTTHQADQLDREFALAVYTGQLPFTIFEEPVMKRAFELLRPDYVPPDKKRIAECLLEDINRHARDPQLSAQLSQLSEP